MQISDAWLFSRILILILLSALSDETGSFIDSAHASSQSVELPDGGSFKMPVTQDDILELEKQVFFEIGFNQLPIQVLAITDSRFQKFQRGTLQEQVEAQMGYLDRAANAQIGMTETPSSIRLRIVNFKQSVAQISKDHQITISIGLIERIVRSSIDRHFGDASAYYSWLTYIERMPAAEYVRLVNETPFYQGDGARHQNVDGVNVVPVNRADALNSPVFRASLHGTEIQAKLLFIAKHEEAHVRFQHFERGILTCEHVKELEAQADRFAAEQLTYLTYVRDMSMWDSGLNELWKGFEFFFQEYSDYAFGESCAYASPQERLAIARDAFIDKLRSGRLRD